MHYVYIVECCDNTLYTGWTVDLDKRIQAHNDGKGAKYTRIRKPVKLVYYEVFDDKSAALKREYEIKQFRREKKYNLISAFNLNKSK